MTQEGLVNLNANGRPVPWLATSWSYSDDGLDFAAEPSDRMRRFTTERSPTATVVRDVLLKQLPDVAGTGL